MIAIPLALLDCLLAQCAWYRRARGGFWFHVTSALDPDGAPFWIDDPPEFCDAVSQVEFNGRDVTDDYRRTVESLSFDLPPRT